MATVESESSVATYSIRAVDRVCDILDTLANAGHAVSLTEVAEGAGIPKSSAFRYLSALEVRHYVERSPDGMSFLLGVAFRPQHTPGVERLTELARPALERLKDELGETTNLGLLDGTYVVHALVAESPQSMRLAARVGERGSIHSTALGKAMCAALPDSRVRMILHVAGMPRFTDATLTDPDAYIAELGRTRARGYGIDEAENQPAGRCVAVAIPNIPFSAGVSVSAPADRLPKDAVAGVARRLRCLAEELSAEL
jgi:IclR family acetate operon transcriptional repressor